MSLVLIVYTFLAVWFVGGLTIFHLYLISTNQTTYENFRYRYDKKDNPHNRGILQNFKDVFFSKIPPSMNDFRSWKVEENIAVGSFTPNIGTDIVSSKEKVDIDGGSKLQLDGSTSIPTVLQNLDYTTVDFGDLNGKSTLEDDGIIPFAPPAVQEPITQENNGTGYSYSVDRPNVDKETDEEADGVRVVVRGDERNNSNTTSPSSDHNVHVLPR